MPAMALVAVVTVVPALVRQADETSYIASDYGSFGASGHFHV